MSPTIQPPHTRRETLLLIPCLALLAALHLGMLNHHSLRNNEMITMESIQRTVPDLIRERLHMNHMPGYFLTVKTWTAVAGIGQVAFRLPSALCGVAGLLALWRLGRLLLGVDLGLFVLLAGTLNEVLVFVSMDARKYSWLFCATALSLWMSVRYLEAGEARDGWGVAAAGLFGLLGHNLYLIVPLCITIYCVLAQRGLPARWKKILLFAWAPALLLVPLMIYYWSVQTRVGGAREWTGFQSTNVLRQIVTVSLGEYSFIDSKKWRDFECVIFGLMLLSVAGGLIAGSMAKSREKKETRPLFKYAGLFLLVAIVPGILIGIAQMHSRTSMAGAWRYYISTAAGAPLLCGFAVATVRRLAGKWIAAGLGLALILILAANSLSFLRTGGSGFREASAFMKSEWQPGDEILASQVKHGTYAFVYYGLLKEKPAMRPEAVKADDPESANAIAAMINSPSRFWAVFLDSPDADVLAEILDDNPARFHPLGPLKIFGDTSVRLYAAPARGDFPLTTGTLSVAKTNSNSKKAKRPAASEEEEQ